MNVRFEGNNGHDADVTRCLLMTQSGHVKAPRPSIHPSLPQGSNSPLTRDVDGEVLDPRLLNWLRIELHQLHYLEGHTHFDREAQRARFTGGKRVIMRPMSAR